MITRATIPSGTPNKERKEKLSIGPSVIIPKESRATKTKDKENKADIVAKINDALESDIDTLPSVTLLGMY